MDLSTIKALITGGSKGIGRTTAQMIIELGGRAVICARGEKQLRETAEEIGAVPIQADVSSADDVDRLVGATIDELGGFNVLVNNAGFGAHASLTEISEEDMRRVWETNVLGAMLVARESAKHFIDQQSGNIINIGSTSGLGGYPGGSTYVSSKFALRGLTECWRSELRSHNIRVMHINPSEVQTGFGSGSAPSRKNQNESKLRPEEIGQTIVSLLALDDRGFIPEMSVWATNPQ